MHILAVKSLARILESKKLNAFRVEAGRLHLHSRQPKPTIDASGVTPEIKSWEFIQILARHRSSDDRISVARL